MKYRSIRIYIPTVTFASVRALFWYTPTTNNTDGLDLLGNEWTPIQNVESICISLQSMLTGNTTDGKLAIFEFLLALGAIPGGPTA